MVRASRIRRVRPWAPLLWAVAAVVLASACGRGSGLGVDEAVEILVIDGVDRTRAECIVDELGGQVPLDKITGIDTDLDEEELVQLSAASNVCAPMLLDVGGVTGGTGVVEEPPEDLLWWENEPDTETLVEDLVRGGVTPEAATCVGVAVAESPEPHTVVADERFLADALLICGG